MSVAETQPAPFLRPDGKEKVTGSGRYTADLSLTGQLHAKLRYADHTHARIVSIDASRARALPGVLAVLTHEDVPDVLYGDLVQDRRLFARESVRFEGDVVAAVAALTSEIAAEAAAAIEVEYEPLSPVSDIEAALDEDAPLVHPDWESYEGDDDLGRHGNVLGYSTIVKGDADGGMADHDIGKLNHTGTHPVHTDLAIMSALDFHEGIGIGPKEARLRYLQNYWTSQVRPLPGILLNTPTDPRRSCAIANVGVSAMRPGDLARTLLERYRVWTVAIDTANVHGVRITPHLFTTTAELDTLVRGLKELAAA
jgi:CO/xanthine dehydrogenase Mo-binding subunit